MKESSTAEAAHDVAAEAFDKASHAAHRAARHGGEQGTNVVARMTLEQALRASLRARLWFEGKPVERAAWALAANEPTTTNLHDAAEAHRFAASRACGVYF